MKPRKHAETIRAWADGAAIQYRMKAGEKWVDSADPAFVDDYEYRVKPAREYPESMLTSEEIHALYGPPTVRIHSVKTLRDIACIILRHAIDAGQVVTREEFDQLCGERDKAVLTLMDAGYTDNGGQRWKPPLGNAYAERQARDMAVADVVIDSVCWVHGVERSPRLGHDYVRSILPRVKT